MAENRKLCWLSYHTLFSATGDMRLSLEGRACFANVLNRKLIHNEVYEIYLFKDLKPALEKNYSNYCPLTKEELTSHIRQARRLFEFTYKIEEIKMKPRYMTQACDTYKITLTVSAPHLYHRYLLAWIRYAYEFPYNMVLLEAVRLKKFAISKEMISNLFLVVTYTFGMGVYGEGHSISRSTRICNLLKETTLKAQMAKISGNDDYVYAPINNIYPTTSKLRPESLKTLPFDYRTIDEWMPLEKFNERVESYVENYKILKHIKI